MGIGPIIALLVATAIFYWEILRPDRILADYDVWTYFYPLRAYAATAFQAGRFPLWTSEIFLGVPFFANPQTGLLYPGTLIFYFLPVPYAYSLSVVVHVLLAAAFTYAFARVVLGVATGPALVAAGAFAFGGAVSAQVGHVNQLSATPWLPLVALCADRAYQRRSWAWGGLGALGLGLQLLAGHAQITYMTGWVIGLVLGWRIADLGRGAEETGSEFARRLGLGAGWAIACGLAIVLPGAAIAGAQLVPTVELAGESIRGGGLSYEDAVAFSLPPPLLGRALLPGYWADVFSEFRGSIGTIPLLLAILALAFGPGPQTAFAAAVSAVGLLLAFGGANPLYPLLYEVVPGIDLFRVPARWLLVYTFGASCLAALGAAWAISRPVPPPSIWRPPAVLAMVAWTAVLVVAFPGEISGRVLSLWVLGFVAGGALILLALRQPSIAVVAALVIGTLLELRAAALNLPVRYPVPAEAYASLRPLPAHLLQTLDGRLLSIAPTEYEVPDHAEIADRYPELSPEAAFAFKTALKLDEVMSPNVSLRYGLPTVDGYDGGVLPLRRYLDLATLLVPRERLRPDGLLRTRLSVVPEPALLDIFGVRAVIGDQVLDLEGLGRTNFPPLALYQRPASPPATRLIPRAEVGEDAHVIEVLRLNPGSARQVVRLAPGVDLPLEPSTGQAEFHRLSGVPERLAFTRAAGEGSGYLVVDDSWLPGWRAWIDGVEAPLYRANVLFKAVWVPPAAQRVELTYEPPSVKIGAAVSGVGLVTAGALIVLGLLRRRS